MRASLRIYAANTERITPKYYKDPRYPVTSKLVEVFGGFKNLKSERRIKPQKSHDRMPGKRAEIVSEQLCGRSFNLHPITTSSCSL